MADEDLKERLRGAHCARYDHGGGRFYWPDEHGNRHLIVDFYGFDPDGIDAGRMREFVLAAISRAIAPDQTPVMPAEADVLAWAVRSFGPVANNVDERAARVAEEAIEIAQVEGVPLETIKRIADRIYSRPAGERWQEVGGTMIGLLSYAAIVGLTLSDCAHREFERVLSKPKEWWSKKHAEKVAAGTADLSPIQRSDAP